MVREREGGRERSVCVSERERVCERVRVREDWSSVK